VSLYRSIVFFFLFLFLLTLWGSSVREREFIFVVCGGIKINKNGIGIELLHSNEGEIGQDREDGIGVNLLCSSWTTFTAIASYFIFSLSKWLFIRIHSIIWGFFKLFLVKLSELNPMDVNFTRKSKIYGKKKCFDLL